MYQKLVSGRISPGINMLKNNVVRFDYNKLSHNPIAIHVPLVSVQNGGETVTNASESITPTRSISPSYTDCALPFSDISHPFAMFDYRDTTTSLNT